MRGRRDGWWINHCYLFQDYIGVAGFFYYCQFQDNYNIQRWILVLIETKACFLAVYLRFIFNPVFFMFCSILKPCHAQQRLQDLQNVSGDDRRIGLSFYGGGSFLLFWDSVSAVLFTNSQGTVLLSESNCIIHSLHVSISTYPTKSPTYLHYIRLTPPTSKFLLQ